jgi:DNA (cytosine-5)-methyltransferase 1
MFCGIGGFRLGLERSGWRCVWANDIDKYACMVYRYRFGAGELVEGDIRQMDASTIPDHTLLTAGFPCQSFSIAGKRKGFEDARGTLFCDITRVASTKKPPLLLLENVKGLLSNDKGRTFARILQALDGLGYDVEWQVLNSRYFGVPQNRERVFIVGHLRGTSSRQIFPIGGGNKGTISRGYGTRFRQVIPIDDVSRIEKWKWGRRLKVDGVVCSLNTVERRGIVVCGYVYPSRGHAGRVVEVSGLSPCLRSSWDPFVWIRANLRIRRLTPRECERLQGFPDDWTRWGLTRGGKVVELSDTRRYKLLGNAVTVNVVEFLGRRLTEVMQLEGN